MMISRLALGTAQFGEDYGIANSTGQVSKEQAIEILNYAKSKGICYLDTASSYGASESVIGGYLKENPSSFKITSKLPPLKQCDSGEIEQCLKQSMERLRVKKLYGYLLHQFGDIKSNSDLWSNLVRLKASGKIEKIGISLYFPDELKFLLDRNIDFDILQVPYSVFDQRFEKYFGILKKKNIVVQVRSVFLQGLVFLGLADLPALFREVMPQLKRLQKLADDQEIPVEALALNFALLNPNIDQVLIGVDSLTQLKNNITSIGLINNVRDVLDQLKEIKIDQEEILMPNKWKLNTIKI